MHANTLAGAMAFVKWPVRIAWVVETFAGTDEKAAQMIAEALDAAGEGRAVNRQNVQSWRSGSLPKIDYIAGIVLAFPEVNPDWLVAGRGERTRVKPRYTPDPRTEPAGRLRDRLVDLAAELEAEYGLEPAQASAAPADETDAVNRVYAAAKAGADKGHRSRGRKRKGGSKADGESA